MKKLLLAIFIATGIGCAAYAEIPAGYYQKANNKNGFELLNMLNTICSNGTFLSYGSGEEHTWEGFFYTDRRADSTVIDMYSNEVRKQPDFNAVEGMHIEHSLPKSWWGAIENNAFKDLNHLFPADGNTNIRKNNIPLGIVSDADPTKVFNNGVTKIGPNGFINSDERCFEPSDEYKGDFARAYLYVATVYNELAEDWTSPMMDNNKYPVWKSWALDLLLQWHRQDPVSEKERTRLEAVYSIQHNRNPFIDYPEMVEHIWGDKKDKPLVLPKETRPYLTSPTKWDEMVMAISYVGTTTKTSILFEGANFTENINISLKQNKGNITLSTSVLTPSEIENGTKLTLSITSSTIATIIDTLSIQLAPDNILEIPINATFTDEFMIHEATATDQASAEIGWTEVLGEKEYTVKVTKGDATQAADLIFSSYVEGSSYNKAISIFNGTNSTVDLKYYSIKKQGNGSGEFENEYKLIGILAPNSTYVITSSNASQELKALADNICPSAQDNALGFNGNDAIGLFHNAILIDVIGEVNNPADWGKDVTLQRKPSVNAPNATFDWNEWTKYAKDDISHLSKHTMDAKENTNSPVTYNTKNNFITIEGLIPNSRYNVIVECGERKTSNIGIINTPNLNTPEAYEATDIMMTQFTANWDRVNHTEGYIVELFQTEGSETQTIEENFDTIQDGKPLPTGWSGTASGHYTSAASSGKSANSLGLKNNGEWIQTATAPSPLIHFEFMYRFPSSTATNSTISVYAINDKGIEIQLDSITYSSTAKTTKIYDTKQLGNNCFAIKIKYNKDKGNLAIDDIIYKYGGSKDVILKSEYTTNESYNFTDLNKNTEYKYRVYAVFGLNTADECISEKSNTIVVNTLEKDIPNALELNQETECVIYTNNKTLYIADDAVSDIEIYNISGLKIYKGTETIIPIENSGIYIVRITKDNKTDILKFII